MARRVKKQQGTCVLIGAGFTARALIPVLLARGMRVIATSRTPDKAKQIAALGAQSVLYTHGHASALKAALKTATHLISSVPPNKNGDPVINDLGDDLARYAPNLKWAGYLSATSVYGDRKGQWAFEDELLRPVTSRGRARIEAELQWLETGAPVHVFRLAGIYGPGRSPFAKIKAGSARAVIKAGHVVNRIHVDDICSALIASIDAPNPTQVYNIADGNPAPPQNVLAYAADLIGAPRPKSVSHESADISDMARSFYTETKRIDISRLRRDLGWAPRFAHYADGLKDALAREGIAPIGVTLTGYIDVPASDAGKIIAALPDHIRLTQEEDGCAMFKITQDEADPLRYHLYERFVSPDAFKAHQARAGASDWGKVSKNVNRNYQVFGL